MLAKGMGFAPLLLAINCIATLAGLPPAALLTNACTIAAVTGCFGLLIPSRVAPLPVAGVAALAGLLGAFAGVAGVVVAGVAGVAAVGPFAGVAGVAGWVVVVLVSCCIVAPF
jgi:hypothetical protein